jgi:RNA polymerase-binding transcription factor
MGHVRAGARSTHSGRLHLFGRLLRQSAAQLLDRQQRLREELLAEVTDVKDVAERGDDHLTRGVGAALLEMSSATVHCIEAALRRLEQGTYGTCADCDAPIPPARLRALPFAERCRDCQERRDGAPTGFRGFPPGYAL